jgi:AcrR family transcriptional regulator
MRDYGGKTGEERRAERNARLMSAGLELFGSRGYAATSIQAVLSEAGLQKRYFGENFASLEDLLIAVYHDLHRATLTEAAAVMDQSAPPIVQFRQLADALMHIFERDPRVSRIQLLEVVGASPQVEEHRQQALAEYAKVVEKLLPAAPAGSDLNLGTLAKVIVVGTNDLFLDWLSSRLSVRRHECVEYAVLLFQAVSRQITTTMSS